MAIVSVAALVLAMVLSCTSAVHVGFLSIVLAWIVAVYIGGLPVEQVIAGFPSGLFLTLVGVTLLFSQAQANATLEKVAGRTVLLCRGVIGAIPVAFFMLTAVLSAIGPGNIASTALMAPVGMAVAGRYRISPFLMAIMIANGASAGSVSPLAPTGVVVNRIVSEFAPPVTAWEVFSSNLLAHAVIALPAYLLLGGWRLFARRATPADAPDTSTALDWRQWLTLALIALLVVAVIGFRINVGLAALAAALVLTLAKATDDAAAAKAMPWGVIMLVCGVTVLVSVVERTGGMDLFSAFLARLATPDSSTAVAAFFSAALSIYSSTTGVVLPALLPTIPGLVERMGGGDAGALVASMTAAGHLVDVSPLSTLGALCLAAAPTGTDTRRLFNQLMAWGITMAVVGSAVCWLLFG